MGVSSDQGRESDRVYEIAAELFALLAAPIRLRIVCTLGQSELNVKQLLDRIETTQPNLSQHLATLYRSGVLVRRRKGSEMLYRVVSDKVLQLCLAIQDPQSPMGSEDPSGI